MSPKEATRERLLEAAEGVFADKGFYEAAVDEIVRRSKTSKGAVYFHFPSKESLFLAVMDQLGERLVGHVERKLAGVADPVARLDVALKATVETLYKHKTLAKLLLIKGYSMGAAFAHKRQEIFSRLATLTERLLDDAVGEGQDPAINREVAAYAWLGSISEVVVHWIETGRPHPVLEGLPTLRVLLFRSIGLEDRVEAGDAGEERLHGSAVDE